MSQCEQIGTLSSNVSANKFGNKVTLNSYTSDQYIFPNDGYLYLHSNDTTSGKLQVYLLDADTAAPLLISMAITATNQTQIVFVRKGMKAQMLNPVSGANVFYVPLHS